MFDPSAFISSALVRNVGWALVHFGWQALAVALLLRAALLLFGRAGANVKYLLALGAMGLLGICPAATFAVLAGERSAEVAEAESVAALDSGVVYFAARSDAEEPRDASTTWYAPEESPAEAGADWKGRLEPALPVMVAGWAAGVCGLTVWHVWGWVALQWLRSRRARCVRGIWSQRLKVLAARVQVRRGVELLESAVVDSPVVLGWVRPAIVVPASMFCGLPPAQVEALLLHELAHIRRWDYLVNLVQTAIETLGFYHPAVWWVSRVVRRERENCCDDLAVAAMGDHVAYAEALTEMEKIRGRTYVRAVAASGGSLYMRILRVLGRPASGERPRGGALTGTVVILAGLIGVSLAVAQSTPSAQELLARYGRMQDQLVSFVIRTDSDTAGEHLNVQGRTGGDHVLTAEEVRYDGGRTSYRGHWWGNRGVNGEWVERKDAYYKSRLWDGKVFYQYDWAPDVKFPQGLLSVNISDEENKRLDRAGKTIGVFADGVLLGRYPGGYPRIDAMLKDAQRTSVRPKRESVGDFSCYVVDAKGAFGQCTVWFDPEHGYGIARAVILKGPGDKDGQRLLKAGQRIRHMVEVRAFGRYGDVWLPIDIDRDYEEYYGGPDSYQKSRARVKVKGFALNPDHEALQSFIPDDIREGASASRTGRKGRFEWHNGRIVGPDGEVLFDSRYRAGARTSVETDPNTLSPQALTTPAERRFN